MLIEHCTLDIVTVWMRARMTLRGPQPRLSDEHRFGTNRLGVGSDLTTGPTVWPHVPLIRNIEGHDITAAQVGKSSSMAMLIYRQISELQNKLT